jgi:hypothetical protein
MSAESLGNAVVDGKVPAFNDISGYHIRPFEDGCKITYMVLNDTTGTPDWMFRNFGVKVFKQSFRDLIEYV